MRTTISIRKSLFEQSEQFARKLKVSRSHLFTLALKDYIQREHNRELFVQINAAYADIPDTSEKALQRKTRHTHQHIVKSN